MIDGRTVCARIDTVSDCNVIPYRLFPNVKEESIKKELRAVNCIEITVYGEEFLKTILDGKILHIRRSVASDVDELSLGIDFLKKKARPGISRNMNR